MFWQKIKGADLNGGTLFEGDDLFLIRQNSHLIEFEYGTIIGKLLFWSWVQLGSWPRWLDPIHLQYAINGKDSIQCTSLLSNYTPYLHKLSDDIKNNKREMRKRDLDFWIQERGLNVSYIRFK